MKISFLNQQKQYKVTAALKGLIRQAAETSLAHMGFDREAEISVVLTDNQEIRALNAMHRGIDRATDVLSFPMFEYDENGELVEDFADEDETEALCLGDIVISLERAAEQAEEYGHSFAREVGFLTVHSMLHLLGYDHMTPEEESEMFAHQEKILEEMGLRR